MTTQQEFLLLLLLLNRLESVLGVSRRVGGGVSRLHNSSFCWTKRNQQQTGKKTKKVDWDNINVVEGGFFLLSFRMRGGIKKTKTKQKTRPADESNKIQNSRLHHYHHQSFPYLVPYSKKDKRCRLTFFLDCYLWAVHRYSTTLPFGWFSTGRKKGRVWWQPPGKWRGWKLSVKLVQKMSETLYRRTGP